MESRFPQVCETCAPAVEDRIRSTGYAAKTDHLRRMMNRTRGAGVTYTSWSRKRLGALMGAFGWSVGLLGQLSWHALGTLPKGLTEDGLIDDEGPQSIPACLGYTASSLQSNQFCNDLWQPWLAYALGFSLLCFWWNPRMQYKLKGGQGRIVGHVEYYKLQLIALATRYLSWKLTAKDSAILTDPQAVRALHAFTLVLQVIVSPLLVIPLRTPADTLAANVTLLSRHPNRSTSPCFVPRKVRALDTRSCTARHQYNYPVALGRFQSSVSIGRRTLSHREVGSQALSTSVPAPYAATGGG